MKNYEELTFTDDFMFSKIMQDESICKQVVELLLNVKVGKINFADRQKDEKQSILSHGVRFDVYLEDSNKIIDIEMQTTNTKDILERSLYYQSMITVKNLQEGKIYKDMKESYVIFLCLFDLFNLKDYKYTLKTICKEYPELKIDDKCHRIFYNCIEYKKCPNKNLQNFLKYLSTKEITSDLTKKIEDTVDLLKTNEDWRNDYMTLEMKLNESRYEGIAIGEKQGIQQTRYETARIALQNNLPLEMIQKLTSLSKEEILAL